MGTSRARSLNRRDFLRRGRLIAAGGAATAAASAGRSVAIVLDSADATATSPPVRWAAGELRDALHARGIPARLEPRVNAVPAGDECVLVTGAESPAARRILQAAGAGVPAGPEALAMARGTSEGRSLLVACAGGPLGGVYALTDLADRARHAGNPLDALALPKPVSGQPANRIRSITRCFVSDVEDKPWYNDRAMWPQYLSMLAAERFNRFSLAFGIGYDFLRQIRDCYFHFAYPFLVSVPGYNVRARGLPDSERDRNLEMLQFIARQTAARGLHFQLALWTHGYHWTDSPQANYTIGGVTPENHAAYCRDALYAVLEACPEIRGVTLRIHGESGVKEGDYDFWRTLFEALVRTGRKIEIDMHAKGMTYKMIDVALATGMPVKVSPKYWAEHMGLPYHQSAIRELEMPPRDHQDQGFFALSGGSRKFLRYGYGDLLREKRRHGVLHRIWPGTQRALLWGDPAIAAGYGRVSSFGGSDGVEICEPLSFKGRKGSGLTGGRCAYADESLKPRWDWEKFRYTYRLWGRLLYNPEEDPETWRRQLRHALGKSAPAAEAGLANASRILPLVTTAHDPSAANNLYWPELYTNMSIVDAGQKHPYGDTPSPKVFGNVSPLDPELFSRVNDFADALAAGAAHAQITPLEVAQWLEDFGAAAARHLSEAQSAAGARPPVEFRRLAADVAIQAGLGRFYAWKLRSGVLYRVYEKTGSRAALEQALAAYRKARASWAELAEQARPVYRSDITYGYDSQLRGHWLDRLPAIDQDIAAMERHLAAAETTADEGVAAILRTVASRPARPAFSCRHTPAAPFRPGEPVAVELSCEAADSVLLRFRHVNQGEHYQSAEMRERDRVFHASIPADYTQSPYALEYYFELRSDKGASLYPLLQPPAWRQPYFVVQQA